MKEIIYFRESALQSVISDTGTLVMFAAAMALNHFYLGDSAVWAVLLFVGILFTIGSEGSKRRKDFTSKEELLNYLKDDV